MASIHVAAEEYNNKKNRRKCSHGFHGLHGFIEQNLSVAICEIGVNYSKVVYVRTDFTDYKDLLDKIYL